jgi:hypothetical protein
VLVEVEVKATLILDNFGLRGDRVASDIAALLGFALLALSGTWLVLEHRRRSRSQRRWGSAAEASYDLGIVSRANGQTTV